MPAITAAQRLFSAAIEWLGHDADTLFGEWSLADTDLALMLKFPNMEHDEPYMAHVPAGKTAEIIWTFNRPGDFDFACLIPGHYQAGMKGTINVSAR